MKNRGRIFLLSFLLLFSLTSFAGTEEGQAKEKEQIIYFEGNDPWEAWNRRMYYYNYLFDHYFFRPVTNSYQRYTPVFLQNRVGNFFQNTKYLSVTGNSFMQGKGRKALRSIARLSINSILGLGGLFDVASSLGMPKPYEDFGLTLQHYGVGQGPYLILPILGPSNLRDAVGLGVDSQYTRLVETYPKDLAIRALHAVDEKSKSDFDFYASGSPFEYDYVRFLYGRYRRLQEQTHQSFKIGGMR